MTASAQLREQITEDMKTAMRAKDAERLGTVRLLLAAIKQREVDERITLSDEHIRGVVEKLVKQRKDSIAAFSAANRQDLVDKEKSELRVLMGYLPEQLDEAQILAEIDQVIAQVKPSAPSDMGKVMGVLKPRLAGRADMSLASTLLKNRLSGL